jgi:hypothetical protein
MGQRESPDGFDLSAPSRTTDELFDGLYHELRRIAASRMANERPGHTLQATALVNEVWLRLSQLRQQTWRDDAEVNFRIRVEAGGGVLDPHWWHLAAADLALKRVREFMGESLASGLR